MSVSHSSAARKLRGSATKCPLPAGCVPDLLRGRFLCQHQAVGGMGAFHRSLLTADFNFSRAYSRIVSSIAKRASPPVAGTCSTRLLSTMEPKAIEQVQVEIAFGVADSFHAFQIASTDENR